MLTKQDPGNVGTQSRATKRYVKMRRSEFREEPISIRSHSQRTRGQVIGHTGGKKSKPLALRPPFHEFRSPRGIYARTYGGHALTPTSLRERAQLKLSWALRRLGTN